MQSNEKKSPFTIEQYVEAEKKALVYVQQLLVGKPKVITKTVTVFPEKANQVVPGHRHKDFPEPCIEFDIVHANGIATVQDYRSYLA